MEEILKVGAMGGRGQEVNRTGVKREKELAQKMTGVKEGIVTREETVEMIMVIEGICVRRYETSVIDLFQAMGILVKTTSLRKEKSSLMKRQGQNHREKTRRNKEARTNKTTWMKLPWIMKLWIMMMMMTMMKENQPRKAMAQ